MVDLLDKKEAKEFEKFDPKLKDQESPPQPMMKFLEKHSIKSLVSEEQCAILGDFPKLRG